LGASWYELRKTRGKKEEKKKKKEEDN